MKRYFGIFLACFLAVGALWPLSEETISRPDATSPEGLKVTLFQLRGDLELKGRFLVVFKLTNTTDDDITFHSQYGVFVGARCDNQNKDFGHSHKGRTISPGGYVNMKASGRFDRPGTWTFWPAYNINGSWGPFKWNAITVNILNQDTESRPH
jgi:hypothetical protein